MSKVALRQFGLAPMLNPYVIGRSGKRFGRASFNATVRAHELILEDFPVTDQKDIAGVLRRPGQQWVSVPLNGVDNSMEAKLAEAQAEIERLRGLLSAQQGVVISATPDSPVTTDEPPIEPPTPETTPVPPEVATPDAPDETPTTVDSTKLTFKQLRNLATDQGIAFKYKPSRAKLLESLGLPTS